jgi:hypothetical protein
MSINLFSRKSLISLIIAMSILGIIVSACFIFRTYQDGYRFYGEKSIDFDVTGQFGAFFGGVVGTLFALVGTLLIALTFMEQSKQNKREAFESKFYEMLRLHRQNVEEIQVGEKKGREASEILIERLKVFYDEVNNAIEYIINTDANTIEISEDVKKYLEDDFKKSLIIHKLSYGYFFYGINNYYITRNKEDVIYKINLSVTLYFIKKLLSVPDGAKFAQTHYNTILGHYFRHLYQLIKLIADQEKDILNEEKKYEFIRIVRAQLSDYEQILLYYDSLSNMGEKWIMPLEQKERKKMCFIARFKLIKNIPYYFNYFGIKPSELFKTEIQAWKELNEDFFEMNID